MNSLTGTGKNIYRTGISRGGGNQDIPKCKKTHSGISPVEKLVNRTMNSWTDLCHLSLASLMVSWKKPTAKQAENICCTTEAFPCTSTRLHFPDCWVYMNELSVQLPLRWLLLINRGLLTKYLHVLHAYIFWWISCGQCDSKSQSLLPIVHPSCLRATCKSKEGVPETWSFS